MNHVERFKAVMNFQPVDRLPRLEWASYWDKTIERWHAEGLPADVKAPFDPSRYFELDPYFQHWFQPRSNTCPREKAHGMGIVADLDEYAAMRPYLYPDLQPAMDLLRPWSERQDRGEAVIWITLEGFFWFPRSLLGIERHMYAFYDQPELMHRINQDLAEYWVRMLRELGTFCRPCFMTFAEDMSYNHGPMLSKRLFDEFLAPYYRQVLPLLRQMGTRILVDSDGDVAELMPWLLDVGLEGVLPLERQAGVDGASLRKTMPRMLMIGHFDKMVMNRGEPAIRAEFERLLPLMQSGGFIPSVDHQTPPGVSLEQYRCYLKLLEEYTVRAAKG